MAFDNQQAIAGVCATIAAREMLPRELVAKHYARIEQENPR